MNRLLSLIAVAALTPLPALAQPVAQASALAMAPRTAVSAEQAAQSANLIDTVRAPTLAEAVPTSPGRPLDLSLPPLRDRTDALPVPAKASWSDAEGFRLDGTKIAYLRRF